MNFEVIKRSKPPVPLSFWSLRQTVCSMFSRSGWRVVRMHRLTRGVLRKRDRHRTSTKFRLGVISWIHELFKLSSYKWSCYRCWEISRLSPINCKVYVVPDEVWQDNREWCESGREGGILTYFRALQMEDHENQEGPWHFLGSSVKSCSCGYSFDEFIINNLNS
jgi:hypothetical protein